MIYAFPHLEVPFEGLKRSDQEEVSGTKVAEVFILLGLYRTQTVGQLTTVIESLGNRAA